MPVSNKEKTIVVTSSSRLLMITLPPTRLIQTIHDHLAPRAEGFEHAFNRYVSKLASIGKTDCRIVLPASPSSSVTWIWL
ncbi:hypothetical protein [Paenibacillus glacialis]|uniref:hypothetical protein n=1 Tax=Paenibacillus glacialis TaxID=494026 RepID=UPI0013731EE3|nr:hypothetical protein [Paenibacillus glacialis]